MGIYYKVANQDEDRINNILRATGIKHRKYVSALKIVCEEEAEERLGYDMDDEYFLHDKSDDEIVRYLEEIDELSSLFYNTNKEIVNYDVFDVIEKHYNIKNGRF